MNLDKHITAKKPKNNMVIDNNKKPDEIIIEDEPATITRGKWKMNVLFSLKNNGEFLFKRHRKTEPAKGNAKKIAEKLGTEFKMPENVYLNENEFGTFLGICKAKELYTMLKNFGKELSTNMPSLTPSASSTNLSKQ